MGLLSRLGDGARKLFSRSANLGRRRRDAPIMGELIRGNYASIGPGPWHELVDADWLGPCTPHRVPVWQLKRMRRDTQLSLGLRIIRSTFAGLEWHVRGGTPRTRAFIQKTLREGPLWHHLMRAALNSLDFGFQAVETVWEQEGVSLPEDSHANRPAETIENAYVLGDLVDLDPAFVRLKVDDFGHLTGLVFGQQELPDTKMLVATSDLEFRNWYGQSILLPSYLPWYWDNWAAAWMMRYAEGRINPAVIATAPWEIAEEEDQGGDPKPQQAMHVAMREAAKIRNGSIAGLPFRAAPDSPGVNMFGLELLKDEGRIEQYISLRSHLGAQKMRGLGIPEKTVQQDKQGSFAVVDVHLDMFLTMLEERKQQGLCPFFNSASRACVRANFGRGESPPYFEGSELARAKQQVLVEFAKAGLLVPQVLPNGRQWRPIDMIDWTKTLEALDAPLRGTPDQVATTMLPQVEPLPGAPAGAQLSRGEALAALHALARSVRGQVDSLQLAIDRLNSAA